MKEVKDAALAPDRREEEKPQAKVEEREEAKEEKPQAKVEEKEEAKEETPPDPGPEKKEKEEAPAPESPTPERRLAERDEVASEQAPVRDPQPVIRPRPKPERKARPRVGPRIAERKLEKKRRKRRGKRRAGRRSGYLAKVNAPGRLVRGATRGSMKGPRQTSTGARVSLRQVRQYGALVRARIARYRPRGGGDCRVVISFSLSTSGSLRSARIARSSCGNGLARAALAAVRRAAPFPRPPAGVSGARLRFSIPFTFR